MIVYISGNTSCSNNYERQFANAEKWLTEKGYQVINPISVLAPIKDIINPSQQTSIKVQLITYANAILMLNGWQASKDATFELQVAKAIDKKIMYQDYYKEYRKLLTTQKKSGNI